VRRSFSGRLSGPGRLWWSAGGGVLLLRISCSSLRNDGDGGSVRRGTGQVEQAVLRRLPLKEKMLCLPSRPT
jgi:hypothetical protein